MSQSFDYRRDKVLMIKVLMIKGDARGLSMVDNPAMC
jgi:hypothetical protein